MKGSKVSDYIRRKTNGVLRIWRTRADGSYGNATPCILCSKCIHRHGLIIECTVGDGEVYRGPPEKGKFTTLQKLHFGSNVEIHFPINLKF